MANFVRKLYTQGMRFLRERAIWIKAGRPMRTPEQRQELFQICASNMCREFKGDHCGVCGCFLHPRKDSMNKLAWATTECPHENKYWEAEPEYRNVEEPTEEDIEKAEIDLETEEVAKSLSQPDSTIKPKKGCGCKKR